MIKNHLKQITFIEADVEPSSDLNYHLINLIPLCESPFRYGSERFSRLMEEVRYLYNNKKIKLIEDDEFLVNSDLGYFGYYNEEIVPLDLPFIDDTEEYSEAEYQGKKVRLNRPIRGGSKKFYVFVKDGDKVKKVSFGDPDRKIKNDNPARAKSFQARHNCKEKKDKTTPGYWSCNIARYKSAGLSSKRKW
jgi:hypothetical protein